MNELQKRGIEFKRKILREELRKCTGAQIALFNKIYISIDEIKEEQMNWAYTQIQQTLEKNSA